MQPSEVPQSTCFNKTPSHRSNRQKWIWSFQRLKAILAAPHLMRDLPRASHKAKTFGLEAFHSLLMHFAPKSSKFTYEGMLLRTKIAALHYNENSGRGILTDPSGAQRISQRFSQGEKNRL
ncbi:hypothetical protein HPB49_024012 [Dermacentor silvarum]|uniref:Uncharacterized protein n=1 Tax=Dermacentor silvarum TaxID=543639 RepID=A0ACB8D941_DERSI|nr:hypothetical protein HPB49_024012 [Dermacentor silvarum]